MERLSVFWAISSVEGDFSHLLSSKHRKKYKKKTNTKTPKYRSFQNHRIREIGMLFIKFSSNVLFELIELFWSTYFSFFSQFPRCELKFLPDSFNTFSKSFCTNTIGSDRSTCLREGQSLRLLFLFLENKSNYYSSSSVSCSSYSDFCAQKFRAKSSNLTVAMLYPIYS